MTSIFWYPGHELILTDIVRAENCYLYDSAGKRYVDLESGVWCTCIGHGNPRIGNVIARRFSTIGHTGFCYASEIVEEAAQEILSLLDFEGGRCVFLCSGSEAVEFGVRIAGSLIDRPMMLTMTDSYFGAYGSARERQEDEWHCFDWSVCADCPESKECHESCEHLASIPFEEIGGFLFEPGSSSGLVRFPPEKLVRGIAEKMWTNDGLLLVNEVTTGVGRTGKWFGYEHYGISPDIAAIGKGIGNGYPVSVAAFSRRVLERLGDGPVNYAQSHQNDPLGAAVALEVIRVIREDGLIERGREIAAMLADGLENLRRRTGRIKELRGRGLMIAIELEDDDGNSFAAAAHRALVRRGFVLGLRPGTSVFRLDPSLTVDFGDIEKFLQAFEGVLDGSGTDAAAD
ncbi:MAG: aspartate aminotransferase family protein [Phycisphaerales bacterium]|nr:MAG: aspartate aminotransferase family protein [Phycisphaerales bacterium]